MKTVVLSPNKQKKRLGWLLLLFFLTLSAPVYYLLQTVYAQLENEAYFTSRHQAESLADQLELNLQRLLEVEQNRPIAEYRFFNVMENPLLSETAGVKFSPLSEIPPKTGIKGLVGYFQINTDGSFHLPALPEAGMDNLSGLSLAELDNRLKLKHQLRDLLSNNTSKNKPASVEVTSVVSNQPYKEEFKQSNITMADDLSPEPLAEKLLDKRESKVQTLGRLLKSKQQQLSKKYKTRRETVQLPDQSMASSYFNRSKDALESIAAEQESATQESIAQLQETTKTSQTVINIVSFESEVTPLQLLMIGQDYFCFYRYIWHDSKRYTQGFIVNSQVFLEAILRPLSISSAFNSLIIENQAEIIHSIEIDNTKQAYALYKRTLSAPFQEMKLQVNASKLGSVPGTLIIDLLALSIYGIFMLGFIAFYRLGGKQIDLAKQQQNFISSVSHELKTPLTSIRMYGEMLRSGWIEDEAKKQSYYDFIFFESERLSRLIANVLQLARLGHQHQPAEIISSSAERLLNQIPAKVEAQIEASSFQLQLLQPVDESGTVDIKVDEDAFFQIVINLVDNAIKFANHSSIKKIDIGFKENKKQQTVNFFIRDYGDGIKKDQLKKIFQLFYRSGDELTRTTPGTGIGLALVVQLAKSMNATVDVVNRQPGAEFQIKLPMKRL